MDYKPIETVFVYQQFEHKQIKREGDIALYKKNALKGLVHPIGFDAGYEIVRIKRHDGYVLGGVQIHAAETYPSSEAWGSDGFTASTLNDAEKRFDKMLSRQKISSCI